MYLNAYVPRLQHEKGVVHFFVLHRGKPVAWILEPRLAATPRAAAGPRTRRTDPGQDDV
jgi:hypothetical protein